MSFSKRGSFCSCENASEELSSSINTAMGNFMAAITTFVLSIVNDFTGLGIDIALQSVQ